MRVKPTLSGGNVFITLALPKPWPTPTAQIIQELHADGGTIQIACTPNGSFRLGVYDQGDRNVAFVESIPIAFPSDSQFILRAEWDGDHASLEIDGVIIGDTRGTIPRHPTLRSIAMPVAFDFTTENAAALKERRLKLASWTPRSDRIAGGQDYIFDGVRRERAQLLDLVGLVKQGRTHHIAGISTRLRMLIATGKPLAVLQSCAAMLDMPLTLYTSADPRLPIPESVKPLVIAAMDAGTSAVPIQGARNPIDLDVWLGLPAASVGAKDLTNEKLIRIVADTMGAHLDHDIVAEVPTLGSMVSGIGSVRLTVLDLFLLQTAEASIQLCEQVLDAMPSGSSGGITRRTD